MVDKPLFKLTKGHRENMQIIQLRNKKVGIKIDTEAFQKAIKTYIENLYSTKLETVKEMDYFLNRYCLPMLNQDTQTI